MGFKFRTKCVVACGTPGYKLEINELRTQVSLSNKINEKKKTNWVSCLQKKYNKLRTMPSQEQRNVWDVNVQVTERSQNFKYEHEDSTHSWRLRNKNNNFYLNVTHWLARPGGTKLSKLIEKVSKKELNDFPKRFCAVWEKEGWHTVNSIKSIWEPPLTVWSPFLSFPFLSFPSFLSFDRTTTEDDLVFLPSLFRPTRTRESTPANACISVFAKNPWRSWIF